MFVHATASGTGVRLVASENQKQTEKVGNEQTPFTMNINRVFAETLFLFKTEFSGSRRIVFFTFFFFMLRNLERVFRDRWAYRKSSN